MKRSTKLLVLLLCLAMVGGLFAACGEKKEPTPDSTTTTPASEEVTTAAPTPEKTLTFEDFGNREFHVLGRKGRTHYLDSDGTSSDRVEIAAYTRNSYIEDMFNLQFILVDGPTGSSDGATASAWITALAASTGEYDVIVPDYWWKVEQRGILENLLDLPHNEIETDDEWWYDGWNRNTTINGKMFTIVGDAAMEVLENIEMTFVNKQMAANNGIDIYDDVEAGEWTLEQMQTYGRKVATNLDDKNSAVFGTLYDQHSVIAQGYAAGLKLININENGIPAANYNDLNNYDIISLVRSVATDELSANYENKTARAAGTNLKYFREGRALFYNTALYMGKLLKSNNLSFDYGVIPMPKYNAEQKDYISTIYGVSFFGIPTSVKDVHCAAVILNAMNWLSNPNGNLGKKSLTYEYFETVLKNQIADDETDANMIQMARDNLYVDFAFVYDSNLKVHSAYTSAANGSKDLSSQLETIDESFGENLRTLIGEIYA